MLTVAEILMRLVCESLRWLATIKSVTCVVLNRSPANLCDAVAVTGELAIRFVGDAGRVISYLIDPISSLALRQCFLEGIGLGTAPAWLVQDLIDSGDLVQLLPKWNMASQPVHLLYPSRRYRPLRSQALLQFMADRIPRLPGFRSLPS